MKALFGENLNLTVVLEVKVEILTDIKKNYSELVPVDPEVESAPPASGSTSTSLAARATSSSRRAASTVCSST